MTFFRVGPAGIPGSIKTDMNNVLNKKFGTTGQDYPPTDWPTDVNLLGELEVKTASGIIASFTDGADDVPLASASFGIVPTGGGGTPADPVAIMGYSGMTITHMHKNLFDKSAVEIDKYLDTSTGLPAPAINYVVSDYIPVFSGVTIFIPASQTARRWFYDKNKTPTTYLNNSGNQAYIPSADGYIRVSILKTQIDIDTYQIEYGSTATTYEDYAAPETISDTFGRTVYGGTRELDGTLTETVQKYTISSFSGTWGAVTNGYGYYISIAGTTHALASINPSAMLANQTFTYGESGRNTAPVWQYGGNDGASTVHTFILPNEYDTLEKANEWLSNLGTQLEVTLTLATPNTYALDPLAMSSYLGVNNIYCDTGDTSVDYRSSGTVTTVVPTLITKTITDNGTYAAEDDNADGYSEVTVNVEGDEDMNYSTTEHEVGTWIDGSTIYERTFELESQLTVSYSTWTSSGISGIGIAKIMGVELFGISNYQGGGLANIQSDMIMLQTTRNSDAYVKEFSLRYIKTVI